MIKMEKIHYLIGAVLLLLIIIGSSLFSVDQRQIGVIFQFGEAVRTIENPGLNAKIPLVQKVEFFDKRILNVDAEAKELTAADGKRVIVDAFLKFKITDPITFYKTVYNYQGVSVRLNRILESSMRKVIGTLRLTDLLTGKRSDIMQDIREKVNKEAESFGVEVIDVRILRADLPKENSAAIYQRMQTEREKEAKQIRAEGDEEAQRVRSKADKESKILLAEAYSEAQALKGEGDAKASKIYNSVYSEDPEFYKFYKTLSTYKESLKDASFIMSPDSDFLKYLNLGK